MWAVQNGMQHTVFAVGVDSSRRYLLTAAACRLCRPLGTAALRISALVQSRTANSGAVPSFMGSGYSSPEPSLSNQNSGYQIL
ncbi:hypothetical protein Anapl_15522 [Anas platyrhynchos]|uniref:Uncharacterized protein n=1 Tax=Anas platyrhynchos TaxID=8839 RepID=R0L965_ANAPL|nr:hypothetical protein Anapl_15522 [Anas platyrhynchos]